MNNLIWICFFDERNSKSKIVKVSLKTITIQRENTTNTIWINQQFPIISRKLLFIIKRFMIPYNGHFPQLIQYFVLKYEFEGRLLLWLLKQLQYAKSNDFFLSKQLLKPDFMRLSIYYEDLQVSILCAQFNFIQSSKLFIEFVETLHSARFSWSVKFFAVAYNKISSVLIYFYCCSIASFLLWLKCKICDTRSWRWDFINVNYW